MTVVEKDAIEAYCYGRIGCIRLIEIVGLTKAELITEAVLLSAEAIMRGHHVTSTLTDGLTERAPVDELNAKKGGK